MLSFFSREKTCDSAVIDFPNFASYDLGSVIKITEKNITKNADIILVMSMSNGYVNKKLSYIMPLCSRYGVLISFVDSSTDTGIIRLVFKKAKQGKVLVATNDFEIIQTISENIPPSNVSFLVNPAHTSSQVATLAKKGYQFIERDIITWQEGIIRRILKLHDIDIKRSRGYIVKENLKQKIFDLLPVSIGKLYQELLSQGVIKDKNQLLMILSSMAIKKQIHLDGNDNLDDVIVKLEGKNEGEMQ